MIRHDSARQYGFTLIELLIVIVVIGLLAGIVIVAYTGIQQRARVSVGQSDLKVLANHMELFELRHHRYPRPQGSNWSEYAGILRDSELWDATRNPPGEAREEKSFVFCTLSNDSSIYTIVAWVPASVPAPAMEQTGDTLYFVEEGGILGEAPYLEQQAGVTAAKTACISANDRFDVPETQVRWSNQVTD